MKYILLPIHLIRFWYLESLSFFIRTWRNVILYLEEDLAVGLMWRLLLVPLFHDSSVVGRLLSFNFRLFRIAIGMFAFALTTILMLGLALYWFAIPMLIFYQPLETISRAILAVGVSLFAIHIFLHPHKKVWQVKNGSIWSSSWVKKKDLTIEKLLKDYGVRVLLEHLEIGPTEFAGFTILDKDKVGLTAYNLAKKAGSSYIGSIHFFVASLQNAPEIDKFLIRFNLEISDFEQALFYLEKKIQLWRRVFIWDDEFVVHHLKGVNRGWLGIPTPNLDAVSEDLTRIASKQGYPDFVGHHGTLEELIHILSQDNRRNVILIGPPGSGKSSLVHHLAKNIVAGDAPSSLATKRLVQLDLARLLSGVDNEGQLADRIKKIFEEVEFAQNIIILVEEIHNLGLGEAGSHLNLYSLMLPFLDSSHFQFIATTETNNYSQVIEKNETFARLFTKIELSVTDKQEALEILQNRAVKMERSGKLKISLPALKAAVDLSDRLIHDRVLPDSAMTVLEEAVTEVGDNGWITKSLIQKVVSRKAKVPVIEVVSEDKNKLLNLEELIHKELIDQEEAVKVIADTLRRSATGLREENRPIGSFLFVGPTGVGKTELAKVLSGIYFKEGGAFLRFDMSEYQNENAVDRLIGENNEGGQLTEAVRSNPYSLLLLDEFEKASPKILTLFLQVLDDGRLTDGTGRVIDFKNTIIIATSNEASLTIATGIRDNQDWESLKNKVKDELLQKLKPEFVNRFDDIVLFKPLSRADLSRVVILKLSLLKEQLARKGYLVEFDQNLVAELAQRGFDPIMGARPLRRLVQDGLESNLSKMILENRLQKGQLFKAGVDLL